jgi:hypothetical protein
MNDKDMLLLARRCLWLAYCWNDHNFPQMAPHQFAREEAEKLGINTFEEANAWIYKMGAAIDAQVPVQQPLTEDQILKLGSRHGLGVSDDGHPESILVSREDIIAFAQDIEAAVRGQP